MSTATDAIHTSAAVAWADLKARGGLEPDGRDEGLEETLRLRLSPLASTLTTALEAASVDELVRALFDALHPYAEMFRDTLSFFEKAGVRHGRQQWRLSVDKTLIELQHFRDFLQKWDAVEADVALPAVDFDATGVHWDAWRVHPPLFDVATQAVRNEVSIGDTEVDRWLADYRRGHLRPFPAPLLPERLQAGFSELSALAVVALENVRAVTDHCGGLRAYLDAAMRGEGRRDGLSLPSLALRETDLWLGSLIAGLAYARTLPETARQDVGFVLSRVWAAYPIRHHRIQITVSELLEILSLPIWRKRHELYAVWIATEILSAIPDHDCEIHHDKGLIVFAFRETLLATISTARPRVQLLSEFKTPLAHPVGKGRSGNVQPDFGLWKSQGRIEECGVVVEVKHYKRTANSSFANALTDYASAHPRAQVMLVNHGPVGDVLARVDASVKSRCQAVGDLTPMFPAAREKLRSVVRFYVGDPVRPAPAIGGTGPARSVVAVDVSRSMREALEHPDFGMTLAKIAVVPCAEVLFPIDVDLRESIPVSTAAAVLSRLADGVNALIGPVSSLLEIYDRVIVITDEDGANDLVSVARTSVELGQLGLWLVTVESS